MSPPLEVLRKLGALFRKHGDDLAEEMRAHRELIEQELVARGMTREEARYAAQRRFGNSTMLTEQSRDEWTFRWLDSLLRDVRFALRTLLRAPGFTIVAALSLALGIGANTAIFTLLDAILLEKLPVRSPGELVVLERRAGAEQPISNFSYPAFVWLRDNSRTVDGVFAAATMRLLSISVGPEAEHVPRGGLLVTGNYFRTLGLHPAAGRLLTPDDDRVRNGHPVMVLSYEYWMRRFNRDPSVVGRMVALNDYPFTIVGVAPRGFRGTTAGNAPSLFIPLQMDSVTRRNPSQLPEETSWWLGVMARRRAGVTDAQITSELTTVFRQQQLARADLDSANRADVGVTSVVPAPGAGGFGALAREFRKPLTVLMGMVGVVLIIACANVATLLVARATARQRELAVRMSIGAGRARLIRQLLTESAILAMLGAAAGLLLSWWAVKALLVVVQAVRSVVLDVTPDARVLAFTILVATISALLFGVVPALGATHFDLTPALRSGYRGARGTGGRALGRAIVITQVALSLLLLIGAGLFSRSLHQLRTVDTGFRRDGLMLVSLNPRRSGYRKDRLRDVYATLLQRLAVIPGVQISTVANYTPLSGSTSSSQIVVEGVTGNRDEMTVYHMRIGPSLLAAMGTTLRAGREFTPDDDEHAPKVALVNEAFVKAYFPGVNPIGKHVGFGTHPGELPDIEIVGVVRDTKYETLRDRPQKILYCPFFDDPAAMGWGTLVLRTTADPLALGPAVRRAIAEVDPKLEITDLTTMALMVDGTIGQERLIAFLATTFGALALLLASVGLYGVMSYGVSRRTGEIGIRMALGARQEVVRWMVLRETLITAAIGIAIGLPLAMAATRLTGSMLYQLSPTDPVTLSAAVLVLLAVAAVAGYVPARRAAQLDPLVALRSE